MRGGEECWLYLEYLLIEISPHPRYGHLLPVGGSVARRGTSLVQPGLHVLLVLQLLPEQSVDRVDVGRDWDNPLGVVNVLERRDLSTSSLFILSDLNPADHSVIVGDPLGELLDVLLHPRVLGVEDVHSVQRDPDPVPVDVVVAVAPDMIPLVYDEGGEAELTAGPLRYHGPGEPGPDHDEVVLLLQSVDPAVEPRIPRAYHSAGPHDGSVGLDQQSHDAPQQPCKQSPELHWTEQHNLPSTIAVWAF